MRSINITSVTRVAALAIVVATMLLLSRVTVMAEDAIITTETSHDIFVTGTAPSHFTVALPTTIQINTETKKADYEIKVKGAINPTKKLNVSPRDVDNSSDGINFNMIKSGTTPNAQSVRIDVEVENDKTAFEFDEISDSGFSTVPCTLTAASNFDAGAWSGILTYDIALSDKQ